jgi:hypothetical protein
MGVRLAASAEEKAEGKAEECSPPFSLLPSQYRSAIIFCCLPAMAERLSPLLLVVFFFFGMLKE